MRILLVEDEVSVATFVKKGYENEGYIVDLAYDGKHSMARKEGVYFIDDY